MKVMFVTRLHEVKGTENSEGQFPVVLQTTWERKVRHKRLGLRAYPYQFETDEDGKGIFRKGTHDREKNQEKADTAIRKAQQIVEEHFQEYFDYPTFARYFGTKVKKEPEIRRGVKVSEFGHKVANDFLQSGQVRSSRSYRSAANVVLKLSPKDITFEEFDDVWLGKVESYIYSSGSKGFSLMNHLKLLYGKAAKAKVAAPLKNPFKGDINVDGYDIAKFKKRKVSKGSDERIRDLTREDMGKIYDYIPKSDRERLYIDLWFFGYYTAGVNLTDIAYMKKKDVKNGRWFYERSKTGVGLKKGKPLLPEALEIIERYNEITVGKYIFPILQEDQDAETKTRKIDNFSGYIRKMANRICEELGIEGHFTCYSNRYTPATLAMNDGADRNSMSKLLDHKNMSTLDRYIGAADDEKILETLQKIRIRKIPQEVQEG